MQYYETKSIIHNSNQAKSACFFNRSSYYTAKEQSLRFTTMPPTKCSSTFHATKTSWFYMFFLVSSAGIASAGTVVTSLPGLDGDLPFYLETGYIGVGKSNATQLFYYFVESQRSPALDPLMLWITGGPGCSVLTAFFYESGPVTFIYKNYSGGLPSLKLNSYAWTKTLNILYVDAPVGTGFSYSTNQENYYTDDIKSATETYQLLRKFLIDHPQFLNNQLFIGGDSYSGIPVPIIVKEILNGNEAGVEPFLNLKGYVLGNPKTDTFIDKNSQVPFAHRLTLISDGLYEFARESCNGDYVHIDASNVACVSAINAIDELLFQIYTMNILEPNCQAYSPRSDKSYQRRRYLEEEFQDFTFPKPKSAYWCREYRHLLSGIWVNNKVVRDALHVRENTKGVWKRCNISGLAYYQTVKSTVDYHKNFSKTGLRALIYSGDHDMSIPNIGTRNWIHLLNLTTADYWRAWFVDGQVAGYTEQFTENDYILNYATVKGAGHVAPEYKPKACYAMIKRWMAYFPL